MQDLQDDLADLMADAEEINEVMSRSYGVGMDVDDADLDEELAGLDDELGDLGMDDIGLDAGAESGMMDSDVFLLLHFP